MLKLIERYQGCLLGLAVGDAVGTTLEFTAKGSFSPIDDLVGGGPFNLAAGQWTDDTSMALCLAESLIYNKGFNPKDQMNRYCNWWQYGYMSSTGECFDIGGTVSQALNCYLETGNVFAGSIEPESAGNGSLMRLAPIALFFRGDDKALVKYSGESSRTTHGTAECIDACEYFSCLLDQVFNGITKEKLLSAVSYKPETANISQIATGSFMSKPEEDIHGNGYVVDSLEAALWSFFSTNTFESAILSAANLGEDADTTAAICGQIAGAYYGISGIKSSWLDKLHMKIDIENMATALLSLNPNK
ncbi:MAG: ADP-ribosyl-[dinitrogen reductase] hydrolase [Pseudohongiellaceae bacterium]|jgi:ADP-ribosyl-[dinitrogen reductase] hydrolase